MEQQLERETNLILMLVVLGVKFTNEFPQQNSKNVNLKKIQELWKGTTKVLGPFINELPALASEPSTAVGTLLYSVQIKQVQGCYLLECYPFATNF